MTFVTYTIGYMICVFVIEYTTERELPIVVVMLLAIFWPMYIILLTVNALVYMIEFLIGNGDSK